MKMTREEARKRVLEVGIVPVIRSFSRKDALAAAESVWAGGIPVVEVTMTVPGAIEVIAELSRTLSNYVLIGAGTVLDLDTARRCLDAGAEFLVSPGFNPRIIELAHIAGNLVMAGALTPTEVIAAWQSGADFVKVFPCGALGGPKYIRALRAPLPQIPLVPTGGVSLATVAEYIRAGSSALGVGSELVPAGALEPGENARIMAAARRYVAAVREARAEGEAALATAESRSGDQPYESPL
jgi:2-dehydro-3-deoxyphosphogluconate aldolase / (4S)-4-hydroxy-2-oxoglutarate aldolase